MAAVGIGGFFFRARDPAALTAWYKTYIGVVTDEHGQWEQAAGPTVFMPFPEQTDYFAADKQWTINFRVGDLAGMLAALRAAGIEVITKPEWNTPETGHFARVHDPEGNAVELWEPPAE